MHPWLIQHPPIPTYGVLLLLSIIAGWLLARRQARRSDIDPSRIDLLLPIATAGALALAWTIGALLDDFGGAVFPSGQFLASFSRFSSPNAVLFGAFAGGTCAGIGYARLSCIPLGRLGDVCAAPIALIIAGGRLGCFSAGCCYGSIAEGGFRFPAGSIVYQDQVRRGLIGSSAADSLPVLPVQLVESFACFVLVIVLLILARHIRSGRGLPGEAFLTLAIVYAVLRFFLEYLRADNLLFVGPLTFSQAAAIPIAMAAALTFFLRRRHALRWGLSAPVASPR
jgi:phosphatidylglycerol:prolipoprotein diacylglycerol transferase